MHRGDRELCQKPKDQKGCPPDFVRAVGCELNPGLSQGVQLQREVEPGSLHRYTTAPKNGATPPLKLLTHSPAGLWNVSTCRAPALVAYKATSASNCCQTGSLSQAPTIHTAASRAASAPAQSTAASLGSPPCRRTSRTPLPRQGPTVAARVGAGAPGADGSDAPGRGANRPCGCSAECRCRRRSPPSPSRC